MSAPSLSGPDRRILHRVIEQLAAIPRLPTSPGEHQAAHLLAEQFARYGCDVRIEKVPAWGSYARPVGLLSAVGVVSALVERSRGSRLATVAVNMAVAAAIADDVCGGRRLVRRITARRRTASNVIARTGDQRTSQTLVVLAHHDAAPAGTVVDQRVLEWVSRKYPAVLERFNSNPPLWWLIVGSPILLAVGTMTSRRGLRRVGMIGAVLSGVAMADIARSPAVPGANDNLSGVAVLVALADALDRRPVHGLQVLLVSAGAEEALQEGIRGYAERHFRDLDRRTTSFLNIECVGAGRLVLLEGEGPLWVLDYDADFKDYVARCAQVNGINLLRGLRSHYSTDSDVPRRHGYPVATLLSVNEHRLIPNYHLPTDTPENVDYASVSEAARLTEAVTRALARDANSAPAN